MSAGFQFAAIYILSKFISDESINEIADIRFMTTNESLLARHVIYSSAFYSLYYIGISKSSDLIPIYLAIIEGVPFSFDDITQLMKHNTWLAGNKISFEFYPFFYSILHDIDMENEWNNNYMNYNNYIDSIETILNVMPECGSYALAYPFEEGEEKQDLLENISGYYYYSDRIRNFNKIRPDNQCDKTDYRTQINSNLDFLVLYNLYYLLMNDDLNNYLSSYPANQDFPTNPYRPYGSHSNPALIYGVDFQLNHTVYEDGEVTIVAEDYIELLPGFEVAVGGTFIGEIGVYNPNCNFNYSGAPLCQPNKSNACEIKKSDNLSDSNEVKVKNKIIEYKIYPNPVTDEFNIRLYSDNEVYMMQLVDFSGNIIEEIFYPEFNTNINLSNQPAGLYFLVIKCNNQFYTEKIIKN